jgi:cytochrome c-type biogenesis protein
MLDWVATLGWAFWLGIFTSISPCPLATNIAAISYVGRRVDRPGAVLFAGALYTLGRMAAYLAVAMLVVYSILAAPQVSIALRKYLHLALGPLLILIGMLLTGLLDFRMGGVVSAERLERWVDRIGVWGAFPLGIVFALSFCPVSAGLFFANIIAAIESGSTFAVPLTYGVGTALPVIVFAVIIAVAARAIGRVFNALTRVEWWARMITGGLLIAVGVYMSLRYVFEVFPA